EDRAEFFFQRQHARGEEVGERLFDLAQLAHVGDEAAAFHCEDEVVGGIGVPAGVAGGVLQGIEGAVDFDRGEFRGGVGELVFLGEGGGVEGAAPGGVAPTGDSYSDGGHERRASR